MEKKYLKDYQAPEFEVNWIKLEFDLTEESATVINTMQLSKKSGASSLRLDGEKISLVSLFLGDKELPPDRYRKDDDSLTLLDVPEQFTLKITTHFNPKHNTELSGLYYSGGFLCTQCEAEGFRRITYFLDRPDVMTKFHVTLRADKKKFPVLLSNGNRLSHKDLSEGRHEAQWEDPFKKPSYLFALVAGDLGVIQDQFTTMSQRKINLEIYAPHGKQHLCHHAMASLKKSMKWDEERFGREYDLDHYMIVSIDDFNMGAMENKGLNIFNSRLVLADEEIATDYDFFRIESVVAHEYFHNWTGNRVTLRDWFHLSLKEGLTVYRDQEFSADMTDRDIQRISDVGDLRDRQFTEDASPNAHPVRPESCYAVDNFYTSTIYEKGSEVIRMMATMVGRRGFRQGMDTYFSRHDGQAVTIEDFVKAIAEPNKKDWEQFRLWYSEAGTPEVTVEEKYDGGQKEYQLKLRQSGQKPLHIPLSFELFESSGKLLDVHNENILRNTEGQKILELRKAEQIWTFKDVASRPVLSLLRQFSAPVNLKWQRPDTDLFFLMTKDTDGFNRREAAINMGLQFLTKGLQDFRENKTPQGDPAFLEAFQFLLKDQQLSPALKAIMLELPAESLLIQRQDIFDADLFYQSRLWTYQYLSQKFAGDFEKIYFDFHNPKDKSMDFSSSGRRRLKNCALGYWICRNESQVIDLAAKQYTEAVTMTDRVGALAALGASSSPRFDEFLEDFHEKFHHENVVLNKWFTLHVSNLRDDTFLRLKKLLNHTDFTIKNPNRVYSLLGAFIGNPYCCHRANEEIYPVLVDYLLRIDEINPQVGAYLCGLFDYYDKLPSRQKDLLKVQAERALGHGKLSKNSRELIEPLLK